MIIAKTDRCVVRNQAYQKTEFSIRERHNERKNESYYNGDILPERSGLNVHFKTCEGTYEQVFTKMVEDGAISLRGLKADAKVFDELVFDVNSAYFEHHGGYEYAKEFFEEAYKQAVQEAGGEEYVLSAVMHADERNKALSEQMGRDVFHYHLHVVYLPVVDKEVYFKKNNKNPELAGKLKEVIKQVSHSKKWPRFKDENGHWVNSYSLLQDRFFEHMRAAGFADFERGERGSTAEHLSVLDFKIQQDNARLGALDEAIEGKESAAAELDGKVKKKQERLSVLNEKVAVKDKAAATVAEIDAMGKPGLLGGVSVTADEAKKLKTLAKKGVTADEKVSDMRRRLTAAESECEEVKAQLAAEKKSRPSIKEHLTWFDKFMAALKRAPKRLMATIEDILRQPPEKQEPERSAPEKKRSQGLEV